MIVLSPNLIVSPTLVFPLSHPVIGWRNIVTIDNVTADTEQEDFPATNLANPNTAALWRAEDDTEQHITVEGILDEIDYLAVARHNFHSAQIPVSVEGRDDTEDPFDELVPALIPPDDGPLLFRFEPQSLAEIRLRMQSGQAPPHAAVMYVGKLLVMERSFPVRRQFLPFPFGRVSEVVNGESESGNFLGRVITQEHTEADVDFEYLSPAWYREHFDPFARSSRARPFFFAWNPQEHPEEVGFAWLKPQRPVIPDIDPITRTLSVQLNMRGIAI